MQRLIAVFALAFVVLLSGGSCRAAETDLASVVLKVPADSGTYNAGVAARYINGTIVPPGKEFSFNRTVGIRTQERGFVEGPVVSRQGPRAVFASDVGGGICRLSTALYQAVKKAGLKVTEKHSHSLPVPYAVPGEDAAVAWPRWDFRFVNTSEYPVKICALASGDSIAVTLVRLLPDVLPAKVLFNGREYAGLCRNGVLYVPLRETASDAGYAVEPTKAGFAVRTGDLCVLEYDGRWYVRGSVLEAEPPLLKDGRYFVPFSVAGQALEDADDNSN